MAVTMAKPNPGATAEALAALGRAAAVPLPEDYVAFLRRNDGGRPEGNAFDYGAGGGSGVSRFLSARDVVARTAKLGHALSPRSLVIAEDSCGNLVLLRPDANGAWRCHFWDHEVEAGEVEVAPSFQAFLDALRPISPDEVELDPDQVISAWIDPDLLKRAKDDE